jgi:ABC-type branched-subunit amino acid transport system ATPase component
LLDEPAAGTVAPDIKELITIIRKIRDHGITVILIEHHMDVVMNHVRSRCWTSARRSPKANLPTCRRMKKVIGLTSAARRHKKVTMLSIKTKFGKVQFCTAILEVPKGEVVTLIGSNRAGKTTTMRAISGMIKPTAGEINLHGKRIDGLSYTIAKQAWPFTEDRRVFAI